MTSDVRRHSNRRLTSNVRRLDQQLTSEALCHDRSKAYQQFLLVYIKTYTKINVSHNRSYHKDTQTKVSAKCLASDFTLKSMHILCRTFSDNFCSTHTALSETIQLYILTFLKHRNKTITYTYVAFVNGQQQQQHQQKDVTVLNTWSQYFFMITDSQLTTETAATTTELKTCFY